MRYGVFNLADAGAFSVTNIDNVITPIGNLVTRNTIEAYIADQDGTPDAEISIDLGSDQTVDMVALAGLEGFTGTINIDLLDGAVSQADQDVSIQTPAQQTYAVAVFDSVTADEVVITFNTPGDAGTFDIGYLFIGDLSADLKFANIQPAIESADPASRTRAGTVESSQTYLIQTIQATLNERELSVQRATVVELLTTGFGEPRFWYFGEDCIMNGEVILAVLDSPRLVLDTLFDSTDGSRATVTLGIEEVF